MELIKPTPVNLAMQARMLESYFPGSRTTVSDSVLTWTHHLIPTPLSCSYSVRLVYQWSLAPNVFVIGQRLRLADGKVKLPHVYSTPKQQLCLYYRKGREWNDQMFIAQTLIPWASEWLQFYEFWLPAGIWYGGGIEHTAEVGGSGS